MSILKRGLGSQHNFGIVKSARGRAPVISSTQLNANNEPKTPNKVAARNPLQRKVG